MERTNAIEVICYINWVLTYINMPHFRMASSSDQFTTLNHTCSNTSTNCVIDKRFDIFSTIITCIYFSVCRTIYICCKVNWDIYSLLQCTYNIHVCPIWFWCCSDIPICFRFRVHINRSKRTNPDGC